MMINECAGCFSLKYDYAKDERKNKLKRIKTNSTLIINLSQIT